MRENIKVKVEINGNEIVLGFWDGKEEVCVEKRYVDRCMVCKRALITDVYGGIGAYICDDCMGDAMEAIAKKGDVNVVAKERKARKEDRASSGFYKIFAIDSQYKADVRVVDFQQYLNVMRNNCSGEVAQMLFDLIVKGYNTVNKICKKLNCGKESSIRVYLTAMARAGMFYRTDVGKGFDCIYKINPKVTYTSV